MHHMTFRTLLEPRGRIALWVMLALLGMTLLAWYGLHRQNLIYAEQQFQLQAREVVTAIDQRLRQHEQILLGGAGLFDGSDAVTRRNWQAYVTRLQLATNYPGILGVGFSQVIKPADLQRHINAIRAEGFPDYTVKPAGERALYTSIIYLEPFAGRNLAAFGYDMFSQETRRTAMQAAVDLGQTSISGKVKLVQETHGKVQAGFLMYVPIYHRGAPITTAAERWQALQGFVYSPYRVNDLMAGILGERQSDIDFTIYDGLSSTEDSLMYDSREGHEGEHKTAPQFAETRIIDAYGHRWTLSLISRPAFERQFSMGMELLVLALGIVISFAMFMFIWMLVHRREAALRLAKEMTEELRADEQRLAELNERFELAAESAGIGVWEFHPKSGKLLWSEQMFRLYRTSQAEFSGDITAWSRHLHPDDLPLITSRFDTLLAQGTPLDSEFRILTAAGECVYLKVAARLQRDADAGGGRVIGVNYDITAMRRAEEEINRSRQLLANVLHAAAEFSIIATDPDGVITIFNSGAERMLGYRAEEMVGKLTPAILHLEEEVAARGRELSAEFGTSVDGFRVFVAKAEQSGSEQREWTYRRKDGHLVPVSLTVSVMRDENNAIVGYVGIAQDITQRKQVEATLRDGREKLNEAQRIAKVGSWTLDLRTNQLEWSDEIFRIFEIDKEQFGASYEAFLNAIHPEDREMVNQAYSDSLVNRLPYEIDHRLQLPNGHVKYVQERCETDFTEDGTPLVSRGTVQDITLLKSVELARQEQALHTEAILNNVLDGIITINRLGIVSSYNQAAEKIFGYTADEVIGHNVKMLMPDPYHDQHDTYLRNYLSTGVARIIGIGREVVGRRKDGSTFPMDLAVSEIQYQGAPLFIGMVRDITERKRMDKMKSEFVSTVSHELRTPLTSISGALGLLAGGALGALPEQARSLLDIALKNSQRLTHLINDLLDMEKIAAGKLHFEMQRQPLMPLVEQALVANSAYAAQYKVSFIIAERCEGVEIRVDSQRLMQILSNFLSNAAKFSPADTAVEVSVSRQQNHVRVSVRDHGPGIPADFRERIFQKFSQADSSDTRQKGGTGLGLAITKELVERMGGHVGFESRPGEGALFFCEFPVSLSAAEPELPVAIVNGDAPRILVVEDEPEIAQVLRLMLQRAGYQADVAMDGNTALRMLENEYFAAMTLDLRLPDISGLEVIRQVRARPATLNLPIIVVSARMEDGRLAINGDFSSIDWLPKPIDEQRLLKAIERSLPNDMEIRPRVLHVEDDVDLHQVIKTMAGGRFDFELATSLAQAREMLALERFDLIILDLTLPDGSGWELLPLVQQLKPEPRVVILSGTELSSEEAARVELALLKTRVSPRELLDALSARISINK